MESEQRQKLLEQFMTEYKSHFTEEERKFILSSPTKSSKIFLYDVVRQVFDELGFIDEQDNVYSGFINIIEKEFGLEKNIVEVGGGVVPSLATKIALKQKKGTITVYDPRLIETLHQDIPNLVLKKELFTKETKDEKANLYIAFMPCEATQQIIETVGLNQQDFIIAACEGGPHGEMFDYFESDEEWLHSMLWYARRNVENAGLGELIVSNELEKYNDPYPVFYNRRHK